MLSQETRQHDVGRLIKKHFSELFKILLVNLDTSYRMIKPSSENHFHWNRIKLKFNGHNSILIPIDNSSTNGYFV